MSQLLEALNKIAELSPDAIKPGVTTEQIDEYLHYYYDTNFKLPEEFYQFYQFSDGLDSNFRQVFNLKKAIEIYSEAKDEFGYYSAWLPISGYDEEIFVIRGDSLQRKTAPIIQINYIDLQDNLDWEPRVVYLSLAEMIIDIGDWIKYPYG
ncbi:hypothetical protein [Rivularia sp. UHCC 0363]|uniref:hypothetical protein n=1 Tax=Rivularia sp. UHCC 0363 TaxID=3110244 RepID=UPI002B203DA1|nr:hypothetical protein [Rivularia sp. UHCC 0363]MEA5598508.1 hypothetical protein [Rivularia sp. UHCC 0363]